MSLSETRFGANATGLPGPAPLPSLQTAFSRRAALFGAATVAGCTAAALPARAGTLSPNDARLVAIAAELREIDAACNAFATAHPHGYEDRPEWIALIGRFTPLEDEMAEIPADMLSGALAKARALQVPACRDCARPELGNSLADDLVRLFGGVSNA